MSKGKLAVQVAHAAVSSYIQASNSSRRWTEGWIREGQPKIVCKVATLDDLLRIYNDALRKKLPVSIIKDAGRTEIPPGTITCVGIGPAPTEAIDSITGKLPLL